MTSPAPPQPEQVRLIIMKPREIVSWPVPLQRPQAIGFAPPRAPVPRQSPQGSSRLTRMRFSEVSRGSAKPRVTWYWMSRPRLARRPPPAAERPNISPNMSAMLPPKRSWKSAKISLFTWGPAPLTPAWPKRS